MSIISGLTYALNAVAWSVFVLVAVSQYTVFSYVASRGTPLRNLTIVFGATADLPFLLSYKIRGRGGGNPSLFVLHPYLIVMVQTALFVLSNVEVAVILAVPAAVPAGTVARPEAVTVTAALSEV